MIIGNLEGTYARGFVKQYRKNIKLMGVYKGTIDEFKCVVKTYSHMYQASISQFIKDVLAIRKINHRMRSKRRTRFMIIC